MRGKVDPVKLHLGRSSIKLIVCWFVIIIVFRYNDGVEFDEKRTAING